MSTNLIGTILLNQYRVEAFVASGGMGAVYRVWDLKRNVSLAMKVLHTELAEDPSVFKRFQREARALQKLAHPNIVPFYGLFQTQDFAFLLERFVDGPTLKDILRQRQGQPLPIEEALVYLKALSAAVGYAHANGVVHCDIKPGNVMIDPGGNVYLTDFGIARHTESTTTTVGTAGTPAYMAPEQIRGEPVTPATDVYALGVLLFEMLTGQRPFRGDEAGTEQAGPTAGERIRYAHLNLMPPDPRSLNPAISPQLAQAVLRSLVKQPEGRYKSTQELFGAVCTAVGVQADQVGDWVSIPSSVERSYIPPVAIQEVKTGTPGKSFLLPVLAGGAGIGLIVLIGVIVIVVILTSGHNKPQSAPIITLSENPANVTQNAASSNKISTPAQVVLTSVPSTTNTNLINATIPPTVQARFTQTSQAMPTSTFTPQPTPTYEPTLTFTFTPEPTLTPTLTPSVQLNGEPRGKIVFTCQLDKTHDQLCVINADRSGWILLTKDATNHNNHYASFDPDGNSIVFTSDRTGTPEIFETDLEGNATRLTYNLDKGANAPDISPVDPHQIVFYVVDMNDHNTIWIMNRDGSGAYMLFDSRGSDVADPTWSPDGKQILFALGSGNNKQLYVMNADGTNAKILTNVSKELRGRSDWSPDGSRITFYLGASGDREIYLINPDGTNMHPIGPSGLNAEGPSFSPDSQWIAFSAWNRVDDLFNGCEIYIMRTDGTDLLRLTNNDYCDYQPRWGP